MTMQENIKEELKNAMRAKEMDKLNTLRMLSSAFTNELVSQGKPPQDPLSDEDVMKVLKRELKKRKDSIEQYTNAGRPELAEEEMKEVSVIEAFLPAQMSKEEIEMKIKAKLAESPIDPTKKGQFVGMMMKELGTNADGQMVKNIIDELVK